MRVIYNGIDLMPLETHNFDWEAVYDEHGVDYLYTRVSMAIRAVVNGTSSVVPVANGPPVNYGFDRDRVLRVNAPTFRSPTPQAPPNAANTLNADLGMDEQTRSTLRRIVLNPVSVFGPGFPNTNEVTHEAIRHRLSTPRGQLYIFWGRGMETGIPVVGTPNPPGPQPFVARLFLESPEPSGRGHRHCDCKNGPFPKILSVPQVYGDAETMMLDWAVETFVNEANENDVRQSGQAFAGEGLLSNRFAQTHTVDKEGYTTITTTGTAVFRTDFVFASLADGDLKNPDARRPFLFMPIPFGFTREIDYVRGREDATGVEYSYRDTQVHANFVAGPFTKSASITIAHTQSIAIETDLIADGIAAYERIVSIKANRKFAKPDPVEAAEKAEAKGGGGRPVRRGRPARGRPAPPPFGEPIGP